MHKMKIPQILTLIRKTFNISYLKEKSDNI